MNNTVSIITSEESFINNYGAALQGHALYQTVKDLGFEANIIRYRGGVFPRRSGPAWCYYAKRRLGIIYHSIRRDRVKKIPPKYKGQIHNRECFFQEFQDTALSFYNKQRFTWRALNKNAPSTDIYVCGSDQIWNPYFKGGYNDPGYFLAFAPKGSKKIAYAPSFGCSDLPEPAQKTLAGYLEDFSAISVREKSGVDIVKKYANRDAKWVVDPTLLRTPEQWKAIARMPKNIPEKYILCYRFAESDATRKAIDETAEKLGLPVVSMPLSDVALQDPYQFVFDAGPREFIGLIQNAELVCTDSFHATVFSVLMKTPVCVFLRESYNSGNSMNSRVYSLLEMLHLERLIKTEKEDNSKVLECLDVDYTEAHERLEVLRKDSMDFLERALGN